MAEDDREMMAAEMALGLLEGEDHAAALRRMLAEPAFAREIEDWRERLMPLIDEIAPEAPPAKLWQAIEERLESRSGERVLMLKLRRWRFASAAASALAASLALALILRPTPAPLAPIAAPETALVAQLGPADAQAVLLASYDPSAARLTIAPATIATGGKTPELWAIPEGGKPHSLGLVQASGVTRIVVPPALRGLLATGATLAVSLEPRGGSPTGQPTGPVVALGKLNKI